MNLSEILECNNNPLKEDQVWTVCYKCTSFIQNAAKNAQHSRDSEKKYPCPSGLQSVIINSAGNVEIVGKIVSNESYALGSLGLVLFRALDYSLPQDEEQQISQELENLISFMTSDLSEPNDAESCDEGYNEEKVYFSDSKCTTEVVIQTCKEQYSYSEEQYSTTLMTLYKDASVLKSLLDQVISASKALQKLDERANTETAIQRSNTTPDIGFQNWACMWVCVLNDLREGVHKLRKVERVDLKTREIRLTPYELLMCDITKQKYKLRKSTTLEGTDRPRLNPTPHDLILNFIRSRPSLSPAHERVLRPCPPRSKSLHERLIDQIHEHATEQLRHVPERPRVGGRLKTSRTFDVRETTSAQPRRRRLIPPEFDEVTLDVQAATGSNTFHSTCSENDLTGKHSRLKDTSASSSMDSLHSGGLRRTCSVRFTDSMRRKQLLPPDEHTSYMQDTLSALVASRGALRRSNSCSRRVRAPSNLNQSLDEPRTPLETTGGARGPEFSRGFGRWSCRLPERSNQATIGRWRRAVAPPRGSTSVDDTEYKPTQVECLSLTVEEVMHIRQVLSRADLEKFQYSKELYSALKNEKICFSCKLKRFSIFSWSHPCEICRRKVCGKCLRKLQAPTEKYLQTPVFALAPTPVPFRKCSDSSNKSDAYMPNGGWAILRNEVRKRNDSLYFKTWTGRKMEVCVDCYNLISGVLLVDNAGQNTSEDTTLCFSN